MALEAPIKRGRCMGIEKDSTRAFWVFWRSYVIGVLVHWVLNRLTLRYDWWRELFRVLARWCLWRPQNG